MLVLKELLGKYNFDDQTAEIKNNLEVLLNRVNQVRVTWDKPMTVTSGLRSMTDQLRIYAEKGITDPKKIPMKSKHLIGAAVDIADEGLKLTQWLKDNSEVLESAQLWCEAGNSNWCHMQIFPPSSGSRWFLP